MATATASDPDHEKSPKSPLPPRGGISCDFRITPIGLRHSPSRAGQLYAVLATDRRMTNDRINRTRRYSAAISIALLVGCSDAASIESAIQERKTFEADFSRLVNERAELNKRMESLQGELEAVRLRTSELEVQRDKDAAVLAELEHSFQQTEGKSSEQN